MKKEDLDWFVYHAILDNPERDPENLAAAVGCSDKELTSSLARLESSHLITKSGSGFRALSVQEFMLLCHSRYDPSVPFTIENGVIREKKGPV